MSRIMSVDDLDAYIREIFERAGMNDIQAAAVARVIAYGERDGSKSHGIYRIEGVLRTMKAGKVDGQAIPRLEPSTDAIVRINAASGFSNAAFELGLPALAERAHRLGLAALVVNDCTHFAALWPEVEDVIAYGLAALIMCPSYATVAPIGGNRPLLGTNPLAFGWPRPDREPYVFDFATSVVARGEIELHRRAEKPLPEGWAIDAEGQPTTDPEAALNGAMLPFGGYKGSAIGTMIELLAGTMIGDLTSPEALNLVGSTTLSPSHGELVLAFSPRHFAAGRIGEPFARAEHFLDAIQDQGARLPSQRRFTARAQSLKHGIRLGDEEIAQLQHLYELGLEAVA